MIFPTLYFQLYQQGLELADVSSVGAESIELTHKLSLKTVDKVCRVFVFVEWRGVREAKDAFVCVNTDCSLSLIARS